MSEQSTSSAEEEPPRLGDQIDIVCDWFEAELRKGNSPQIEDLVAAMPESGRSQLLKELVAVEIAVAREHLQPVDFQAYVERFPQYGDVLAQLHSELDSPGLHSATTISASDAVNSDTATMECLDPEPSKHFELHAFAGEGGFGKVWRAYDTKLQRDVAVKIPHQDRPANADISAVLTEARAAARLDHPNIVTVHQVGEGDASQPPFIVTAFIDGPNLRTWLQTHQMTSQQVARMISEIAEALGHAHSRNITHCDVKPGNVLIDSVGKPHLTDFGLAKRMTKESATDKFRAGGTLPYMSPEQASGRPDLDYRTDIYSLGVMLYELLTGQRPFQGDTDSVHDQIINATPKRPRELKATVPEDLEKVCLKCLAKNPADRYQTGEALAEDLRRWMNGESLRGIPTTIRTRTTKWIKRHRRFVMSVAATAGGCLSLALGIWWWNQPPDMRRLVEFTTSPPGCEITTVRLDPLTGDPDPQQIEHARGRSPTVMKLMPGDYLVVAVLDDYHFHEVTRRVPAIGERPSSMAYRHSSWLIVDELVKFPNKIKVWNLDVGEMVSIEGGSAWQSPDDQATPNLAARRWSVPPLFVDLKDQVARPDVADVTNFKTSDYDRAVEYAECIGKRLPTNLELLYVADFFSHLDAKNATSTLKKIQGLNEEPWEWTSTKEPDFDLTRSPSYNAINTTLRISRCGAAPFESKGRRIYPVQINSEWRNSPTQGVRCVRSAHPRRQPKDFVR